MAGRESDLVSASDKLCNETEWLWDGDEDQAYIGVICRQPKGHSTEHYDPSLDLSWPQEVVVMA